VSKCSVVEPAKILQAGKRAATNALRVAPLDGRDPFERPTDPMCITSSSEVRRVSRYGATTT
jgi:hypothetical protein